MRIALADTKLLRRTDPHPLFKYSKEGIILKFQFRQINLSELFKEDPHNILDLLESMLDADLNYQQRWDIEDVLKEFKEIYFKEKYN